MKKVMKEIFKITTGLVGFTALLLASMFSMEFAIAEKGIASMMLWLSATVVMISAFAAVKIALDAAKRLDEEAE